MACFLTLETGGHLLRQSNDGALLLEFCANDNQVTPGPYNSDGRYSWELTRKILERNRADYNRLQQQKEENAARIKAREAELKRLEQARLKDLANQAMQQELMAILRQLQAMQQEQDELERIILIYRREEDDILCILYSLPFMG